ncbi:MAG: carbohydrate-binding protein, partial [Verrucomicrobiota bacterium]
ETICWSSGVKTEPCSEGGMDVCNIENGDYIKVKGVDFSSGAKSFEARVASATKGGKIEIHLDSTNGTLVGTCIVSGTGGWQKRVTKSPGATASALTWSTGGWQTWVTKSCKVRGAAGVHDLYLKFTGKSGSLFTFNWWKFKSRTGDVRKYVAK